MNWITVNGYGYGYGNYGYSSRDGNGFGYGYFVHRNRVVQVVASLNPLN